MTTEIEEKAKEICEKVRYFSGKGQYPEGSPEAKAYLDGVETASAMLYVDLTGTHKTKGLIEEYRNQNLSEIIKWVEGEKKTVPELYPYIIKEATEEYATYVMCKNAHNKAIDSLLAHLKEIQ